MTMEQVKAALASSDEFFANAADGSTLGLLAALSQKALNRTLDQDGEAFFNQETAGGMSRDAVALVLMTTSGAESARVGRLVTTLLNSPAGVSENAAGRGKDESLSAAGGVLVRRVP
jgi:hypothetical protein